MKYAPLLAVAILSGVVGFLVGRQTSDTGRAERPPVPARAERSTIELEPETYVLLQEAATRAETLAAENRRLRGESEPADTPLAPDGVETPGSRRADGTIVGGARWAPQTRTLALGFLGGQVERFFKEANLTEDQKARLRDVLEGRIGDVMQATADYVNGDITGDQVYESLNGIAADGRTAVTQVLDQRQLAVYQRFESGITDFVHSNVVNNEMETLRQALHLDHEQARQVRPFVEERYRRVQQRLNAPIPNMFFKPVRRDGDQDIYDETGRAIQEVLSPEQRIAFEAAERQAATALHEFRSLLVPIAPNDE